MKPRFPSCRKWSGIVAGRKMALKFSRYSNVVYAFSDQGSKPDSLYKKVEFEYVSQAKSFMNNPSFT